MALLCPMVSPGSLLLCDTVGEVPPLKVKRPAGLGGFMRMMYLCYAAIGFAVARWIFRREAVPVLDPVTRFRSQGLL